MTGLSAGLIWVNTLAVNQQPHAGDIGLWHYRGRDVRFTVQSVQPFPGNAGKFVGSMDITLEAPINDKTAMKIRYSLPDPHRD